MDNKILADLVSEEARKIGSEINAHGSDAQTRFLYQRGLMEDPISRAEKWQWSSKEPVVSVEEGLKEIEEAEWKADSYSWCLRVHDQDGRQVVCYLQPRPAYCDRGHLDLLIDGNLDLDEADSFPRYFFSFKEADLHTRAFLKWRLWKRRVHTHPRVPGTLDMSEMLDILRGT